MKYISNKVFVQLLYILTFFLLVCIFMLRFTWKVPRDIFTMQFNQKIVFTFLLGVNILILIYLLYYIYILMYKKKAESRFDFLSKWIDTTYSFIASLIMYIPNGDYPISWLTRGLFKIYIYTKGKIWNTLLIIPRIFLMIALSFDIFYLEQFRVSYIFIYGLLIPISVKFIYYVSSYLNNKIEEELNISIVHRDIKEVHQKIINGIEIELSDFVLSPYNKHYENVEQGFIIKYVIYQENIILDEIKTSLAITNNILFVLIIRLIYTCLFGYICYWYYF